MIFLLNWLSTPQKRLIKMTDRLNHRVEAQTSLILTTNLADERNKAAKLVINLTHPAPRPVQHYWEDGNYDLKIDASIAILTSNRPYGVLRGIETFLHFTTTGPNGTTVVQQGWTFLMNRDILGVVLCSMWHVIFFTRKMWNANMILLIQQNSTLSIGIWQMIRVGVLNVKCTQMHEK